MLKVKQLIKNSFVNISAFLIIYHLILVALLKPIINIILDTAINLSGHQVLINDEIVQFILNPFGLIAIIILLIIALILIFFEFATIINFLYCAYHNQRISFIDGIKKGFQSLRSLFHWSSLGFAGYSLILIPYLNLGIQSSLIPKINIPEFVTGELLKYDGLIGLIIFIIMIAIFLSLIYLFYRLIFVLPIMVIKNQNFIDSSKESRQLLKKISVSKKIIGLVILLFVFIIFALLNIIAQVNFVFKALDTIIFLLINTFSTAIILYIVIYQYMTLTKSKKMELTDSKIRPYEKTAIIILSILIIIPILFNTLVKNSPKTEKLDTKIISHRGSLLGVENTIGSIEEAIKAKADFVEIDVMLTKDNIPILFHDVTLFRLTGQFTRISDLNLEDIKKVVLKQNGKQSSIPTLEETLKTFQNRTEFMIEFKFHGRETADLIEKTVELIEKYQMKDKVVLITSSKEVLNNVHRNYPQYQAGYIIYGLVGNLNNDALQKINANYLLMEQRFANETRINTIQNNDKKVAFWTVNNLDTIYSLENMRANGVITSYPNIVK